MNLEKISKDIYNVDAWMDEQYGKVGSPERKSFVKRLMFIVWDRLFMMQGSKKKMTQTELAQKIGTNKSYISKIENGNDRTGSWGVPTNP